MAKHIPVNQNTIQHDSTEDVVRQSEERLRLMVASARDYAIIILDPQRQVISWSPGAQTMTGYSEADIVGHSGDILFTPEDLQHRAPQQEELTARDQGQAENERWLMRKDSSRFWASGSMSPLLDDSGKLLGFVRIMRDMTGRRMAEEARSFLASIVESSQDSIVTINFDGIITTWNQAAEALYGYAPLQAIGRQLTMLTLPEDLGMLLRNTEKVKHSQKVEIFNTVRRNKDGRMMQLEVVMSPVKDASGLVIGVSTIARDVTARNRAEKADALKKLTVLQQTESLASTGSWEYDRESAQLTWSEGMYRLLGLEVGTPIHAGIYEDFTIEADQHLARKLGDWLINGALPFEQVLRIHVNDTVKHLKISGLVLYNEDGWPEKMLGVDLDITQQVLAQEQVRQREAQLSTLVENIPDIITRWDKDLRLLFANTAFAHQTGQALENLLGKTNTQMGQPGQISAPFMASLQKTFQTGQPQEHYNTYPSPNGDLTYYSRMVPERGPQGLVETVLTIARDITELQTAQQQVRQLAENMQAVLDASPASIGLLKAVRDEASPEQITDFKLAVGNQKLSEFFAQPPQQLLEKPAHFFGPLLWGEQTLDVLLQTFQANNVRYDEKLLRHSGQERWLAVAVSRQKDDLVVTGLDITDLKRAQQQQQFWLKELEKASQGSQSLAHLRSALQERGELLRSASHDLRGQVGIIASATHLLGMAGSETENGELIRIIQRNIRQMTHLMSSLLDYARLEAGQEYIQTSRFDVSQVLTELIDGTEPFAREQGLWLSSSGPAVLEIESDPVQVRRIAQNLLLNALKYTNVGGVTIAWQFLENPSGWQLSVTDTGPGLSGVQLERLRRKARSDENLTAAPALRKPGSEGIGLSIVAQLCALLGGQLTVDSQPGKGTRFEIFFSDQPPN